MWAIADECLSKNETCGQLPMSAYQKMKLIADRFLVLILKSNETCGQLPMSAYQKMKHVGNCR